MQFFAILLINSGFLPVFKKVYINIIISIITAKLMEFVTANLLMTTFNPLHAFIITLMFNRCVILYFKQYHKKYKYAEHIYTYI